jgi:hypothetical protein
MDALSRLPAPWAFVEPDRVVAADGTEIALIGPRDNDLTAEETRAIGLLFAGLRPAAPAAPTNCFTCRFGLGAECAIKRGGSGPGSIGAWCKSNMDGTGTGRPKPDATGCPGFEARS